MPTVDHLLFLMDNGAAAWRNQGDDLSAILRTDVGTGGNLFHQSLTFTPSGGHGSTLPF